MPLPSSGIIVVEKPSSASITKINNNTTAIKTLNSSIHPPQEQKEQQSQIQYYEYYENQLSQRQQQQYHHQQQQQHSTIVVDGTIFHQQQHQQQQQLQLGRSSVVAIGRKIHSSSSTSSSSSASSLCSSSSTLLNKPSLQIQTLKTVPMPQNKQYSQQQIIQHTSHSTTATAATTSNPQHQLHQQHQHVQHINLSASPSIHHQAQHHHHHPQQQQQQMPTPATHMIQVSEEFLEQAANTHNSGNMMISTTGEVINQQQIFKIVSTDGTTGNMIFDATNHNANSTTTTSKVLLSNLTVLSKQQTSAQAQIISNNHQQPQTAAQTINFVNAKNLYTSSSVGGNIAGGCKQQKFTVATANVGGYKGSSTKLTSSAANTQYIQHQPNSIGQQKINMTAGNRSMQMLTTTRIHNAAASAAGSNFTNTNNVTVISNNAAPAQTMVLQQSQKFVANNTVGSKMTAASLGTGGGNFIKKSTTAGTLRMNNSHTTATTAKLMNNLQTTQGVKTFITQTACVQQQHTQQNMNHLTVQQHTTKGGKSKFVKQYNNAILNSAGAVAIATLPHQQPNSQNNIQIQQQHQLQTQTTYINHHKSGAGSTKINKINSKYAQSANMAAQLPPGTQLHQKSINQTQQPQQFQATSSNSTIKFVNAQGTVIQQQQQQQQSLTPQKINKHNQHQNQFHNLQNFDIVDGNHNIYQTNQANANQSVVGGVNSTTISCGTTTTLPSGSSLLTDDIMMVNGTQMTDELSARILQSMSQKSFSNQRYQQQQQQVFQTKTSLTTTTAVSNSKNSNNNSNNNHCNSNNNMLPPPPCATAQNTILQTTNNNSNILLSPREYTLYPTTVASAPNVGIVSAANQQQQLSSIHYNNLVTPTATATASSNITAGSFSSNNYITVSNNSNNMTTITTHASGSTAANCALSTNTGAGSINSVRQAQSAPGSRSQSMERKLHESSMSRKSTEYYKVKIKDYYSGCAFVVPTTATIYTTNASSHSAISLIDFIIPLPSCTTITNTNNNIITSTTNCATMATLTTNSSYNLNQINNNSNHNSLRGNSHHNNIASASAAPAPPSGGSLGNISSTVSNLMGGIVSTAAPTAGPSSLQITRPPSLPPAVLTMEPQAQVIHLQATKTLPGVINSSNDDDDDIIGEEVRPAPVDTDDIRLRILHTVLFDHTYVNPMPLVLPTSFAMRLSPSTPSSDTALTLTTPSSSISTVTGHDQQWSLGGIGAVAGSAVISQKNYTVYGGTQLSSRLHQDDDSYSGLGNTSRLSVGDIDPGEETETAPEGELEDDSVTRCICDLTHDDGYMICCDKCCAWQHVDCMGIDRQNIPEEYLCELCQPRVVDKARARSLQLMKRKEQQQILLTAQGQVAASAGTMGAAGSVNGGSTGGVTNLPHDVLSVQKRLTASNGAGYIFPGSISADSAALQLLAQSGSNLKKNRILKKVKDSVSGKRLKKSEKVAAAATAGLTSSGKPARKETKKNTKRKKAGSHDTGGSTVGMTAAEKHAANLRQWIENYELAVTNHYSPELRARLHAISKQPSLLQSILNTENPILKEFSNGNLENRATTVPHAGGKILISNLDIVPNSPICELRGKYMLTTQYKTQNTSMNMNSPPPNNYHLASYKAHKTPGPFIFFYQLPGTEVNAASSLQVPHATTTTILNPDGTYTTTTTTVPGQQSPPTYLKGPEICVDTRTYGNEARFVRRSCRPNAEIQHLFEKGTIHLFIVALTDIRASTEITIRHEPHDLLAVENKKSFSIIIQPTSTPCACGLTKDCIFGPPIAQPPPAAKSNAGRKSLANIGTGSGNAGNLTAKKRKTNQQNLNRNRSISSSASGDSNMGATATTNTNTVAISLNSPNNASKMPVTNKIVNNTTSMPLTASCNSSSGNALSTLSSLTTIMHDSGVCTSSSSPSVSIPSPTQHIHSPITQQQHQLHQQQLLHNTQIKSTVQLLPQQQQQQLMQSLPTPLVLTSPNMPNSHQQQQIQQQSALQQSTMIIQQHQPLDLISQAAVALDNNVQDINAVTEQQKQPQTSLCMPTQPTTEQVQPHTKQMQHHPVINQQVMLQGEQQQQHQQAQLAQHTVSMVTSSAAGLLETVSPEASIAAVALQSLNTSHSSNTSLPAPSPVRGKVETQIPSTQIQHKQLVVVPATETAEQQQQQPTQQHSSSSDNIVANTSATSILSSPQQLQMQLQSQQQNQQPQHKSPQKNNHSQHNSSNPGRKTPAKHGRTTSISEDNEHYHNEDNSATLTPTSSTPKEKPKLSREDRKMEAILRAIEKMERNQQRKQEQKQTKRQNAGSHNTTPTSPNKSLDSSENSSVGTKRSNNHAGTAARSKKKRKPGTKSGQGGAYNNQRKQRQSRMNSQESVDEGNHNDHDTVTSESDGCGAMNSPPMQTIAPLKQPFTTTPTSSSVSGCITTAEKVTTETANNVDQVAGLLMAFANPNTSSSGMNSSSEQHIQQQSPQRLSQYMIPPSEAATSPPSTPPSQVSSACLLIEAAVGPLESNLSGNSAESHIADFKYPMQAKTKKHLMNNWLHQTEDNCPENNALVTTLPPENNSQLLDSPASSPVVCSGVVSGGLDSLLQAAMSDLKKSQSEVVEEPQNLSIAAQKVQEFIQQTEASACSPQIQQETKHSYEYEEHQPQQRSYINLPTPAVDLTLKTPLTIGQHPSSEVTVSNNHQDFHLPLQVSTCSNNSSVKKRWLRQAISEETHEEFQQTYSSTTTPSPNTGIMVNNNALSNSQLQSNVACTQATITNFVPNGFTTPLKKRRLLLTGKDEVDESLSQTCGDLCSNSTPTSPEQHQQIQMQYISLPQNPPVPQEFEDSEQQVQDLSSRNMHENVDVDVEKYENNETNVHHHTQEEDLDHKSQLQQDLQYAKIEINQQQNVYVTTSPQVDTATYLSDQSKIVIKHENNVSYGEVKEESLERPSGLSEFNDQEDDVDILRSPSPGREMIKAEDNLVKIEPEDTSSMEDVKIDVEREEESMAADDDVVTQHKERKEELTSKVNKGGEQINTQSFSENVEFKNEFKIASVNDDDIMEPKQILNRDINLVKCKAQTHKDLGIKIENINSHTEIGEPKPKRPKLDEKAEPLEENLLNVVKKGLVKEESPSVEDIKVHSEIFTTTEVSEKTPLVADCSSKECKNVLNADSAIKIKQPTVASNITEVTSSASSTLLAVKLSDADTTFTDADAITPPPPVTTTNGVGNAAPIQRHKSLSDDDIQARLHSFHKENILFLQSRNKKTKSSSLTTSSANCLANNNDHHKNRTSPSPSSSFNQHDHYQHHHHHEVKEKSDKSNLKHRKSSSAKPGVVTSKKQKLHKRERTTSSSSSNSHKNSTIQQTPSTALLNKNTVIRSLTSTSSGSSKKLKSLKKSSSGSSTSSNTSLSAYSCSTLALQNCYMSTSSAAATATSLNSDKERVVDKDNKNHRQRTTSTSSGNIVSSSNFHVTPTVPPYPSSKKRQLNFELELTKDMYILLTGGSKHKKETSKLLSDEQNHVPSKKSRKESHFSQKEEIRNATNNKLAKTEKQQDKKCSHATVYGSTPTKQMSGFNNVSSNSQPSSTTHGTTDNTATITEQHKPITTIISQPPQPPPILTSPILREHPTLPHFNNVVVTSSPVASHQQSPATPMPYQSPETLLTQNIPNHVNGPSFTSSIHSNHNIRPLQPPTPPLVGSESSLLSAPGVNSSGHLPFYNTIYGKLLDNSTPSYSLPTMLATANSTTTPPPPITSASLPTGSGVISDYSDTKIKSYSTLGSYVPHTALFGISHAADIKEPPASATVITSSTLAVGLTPTALDLSTEMPAPLPPPSTTAVSGSNTSPSGSSTASGTPLKIHTKTASHDPRLNPQLTAPEPPPQPKRKLSINEYRKRMQQSSSNDSNSGSLNTTPTTPPTCLEPMLSSSSLLGSLTVPLTTNKCTLNSPDHLTQSVDSQIQKELMSTTSAVSSSSSLDSLNSSNSSTSLNDTLLKSSSLVEEDSTKGQFNAAPTLLEKQQESLCARLKSLKEKQSLGTAFCVGSGNRSRFSSFSESVASSDFGLRKEDDIDIIRNRNLSISSSIGGGDLLDNCLEEISSTSTSMSSSREPSPERCYTTHKILTASATTTMTNTSATSHSNNGQRHHHQKHNLNCDKSEMTNTSDLERKKSVDIS